MITGSQGLPTVATLAKPAPTTHTHKHKHIPRTQCTHTRAGFVIKFVYFLYLSSSRKKSPPPDHKSTAPPPTPSASISINSPALSLSPTLSPQFTLHHHQRPPIFARICQVPLTLSHLHFRSRTLPQNPVSLSRALSLTR